MRKLKEGDIFDLKPGMEVYAKIPKRFVYSNAPFEMELVKTEVKV